MSSSRYDNLMKVHENCKKYYKVKISRLLLLDI